MVINNRTFSLWHIFSFICFWYFYFASSFVLRPFSQLFWIFCGGLAIFVALFNRHKIDKKEQLFSLSFFILIIASFTSVNIISSITIVGYYIIYFLVALLVVKKCSRDILCKQILFFSCIHLICTFIQVILPGIYCTIILPLLPNDCHNEIINQMNWNKSFYGFTIQTSVNAMYLSLGAVLCAVKIDKDNKIKINIILFVLTVLFVIATFFTTRRGSSISLLFILSLIYLKNKGGVLSKAFLIISGLALMIIIGVNNIPGISNLLSKSVVLSTQGTVWNGRDKIFSNTISALSNRIIFGYGGGQIEKATGRMYIENAYLSVLLQWGVVGGLFFFIPYIKLIRDIIDFFKNKLVNYYYRLSSYVFILFLIMSFIEDYFGAPINTFILLVIIFCQYSDEYPNNKDLEIIDTSKG